MLGGASLNMSAGVLISLQVQNRIVDSPEVPSAEGKRTLFNFAENSCAFAHIVNSQNCELVVLFQILTSTFDRPPHTVQYFHFVVFAHPAH